MSNLQDISTNASHHDMEQGTDTERSTPSSDQSSSPLPPLIIEPYNTKEREAEEDRFYDELVRDMHVVYMRYYLEKQERAKALEMKNKEISEEQVEGANESQFEPVGDKENKEIVDRESLGDGENEEVVDEGSLGDIHNEEIVEEGEGITEWEELADLETAGESDNEEADDTESGEDKEESADTENYGDNKEGTSSEFGFGGITNIPVQVMIHKDPGTDDEDAEDSEDFEDSEDSEAAVDEGSAHEDTQDNGVIEEAVVSGHSPTDARVQREDGLVGEDKTRMDKGRSEEFSNDVSRKFYVNLDSDEDNEIRDIEGHSEDDNNIDIDNEDTVDEEDHEPRIERLTQHTLEKEAASSKKSTFEPELEQMRTPRYSSRPSLFSVIQKERNQKIITHEDRRKERYNSFSSMSDVAGDEAGDDAVRNTPELFLGQDFSYASDINNSRRKRRAPSVTEGRETKRLKPLAPFTTLLQNKNFFVGEQVVYSLCRCEDHVCNY